MLDLLSTRQDVWGEIRLIASPRSAGRAADGPGPPDRGRGAVAGRLRRHRRGHVRRARRGLRGVGPGRGRPRRGRGRQLGRVPDGPRGPAGGAGDQPGTAREAAQGHHRERELHHAVDDRGRGRAAPGVRAHGDGRRLLPGGLRSRPGRHRHAVRPAGQGGGDPLARAARG